MADFSPAYAELHCLTNFTFLRGASHPEELVARAAALGYAALAITDECSVAGVVRAHSEAKRCRLPLIIGSEFHLEEGLHVIVLATDRASYGKLTALITAARRAADKGSYVLDRRGLIDHYPQGCLMLWVPGHTGAEYAHGVWLTRHFPQRVWIAVELLREGQDRDKLCRLENLSRSLHVPLCAGGNVHMHCRSRRALQDTLTAIRLNRPLHRLGYALYANGERHLRRRDRLARLYPAALLAETVSIADQCRFSLNELRYEYPSELVPPGYEASTWLRELTERGIRQRWPGGATRKVQDLVEHELELVRELRYEAYFLTVHDIVRFARRRGILCQGRGSAANSAICYCLGITEVDPARMELLFERFISRERNEPPDIDVDFEHERREEVVQYIYAKYGRERAALTATVIRYRPRSAIRDVGKALGLSLAQVDQIAKSTQWWDRGDTLLGQIREAGLHTDGVMCRRLMGLVNEIIGFPRHLSQHVGGFVIAENALSHLVPIENAAMPERTVIQWEKDDLEALGLLKVDVLALGMLTAIRKALDYVAASTGRRFTMSQVPAEDPAVYRMMQQADTVGVFQIESRAQMSMLPRLKPACYYDLVIQIAIVRPGPIQGEMVHPYLARRSGQQPVTYPSAAVKEVLKRTLGIPIFQEQVMQLSMVAAGFSAGEADQLRRSMAAWRRRGGLEKFAAKLKQGMRQRGYQAHFAEQICKQIKGFGEYGFPESHSASFALLAYVSAWLKRYHPAAFTCSLLNSQPMGFYAPSQLVQDARRHGVSVRPVDVRSSMWDCSLEPATGLSPDLRLGLRLVKGLSKTGVERLLAARQERPFDEVQDLARRARLARSDLECLAAADALRGLSGHRHRAFWDVNAVEPPAPLWPALPGNEGEPMLRAPGEGAGLVADYAMLGLTLRRHPLALLRTPMRRRGIRPAAELWSLHNGSQATAAGLVICRQRPGSASGVIFVTLEDESGHVNIVVWPHLAEAQRRILLHSRLLAVTGTIQREQGVLHLIARHLEDYSPWLGRLQADSRDFH
ncbi:MAG: error-prone DNA polymerase [Candidatus Tectomicrobia bacterium]|nr:error-prone DNA polymerase [Candidatus Tectomicrobia bacterium]